MSTEIITAIITCGYCDRTFTPTATQIQTMRDAFTKAAENGDITEAGAMIASKIERKGWEFRTPKKFRGRVNGGGFHTECRDAARKAKALEERDEALKFLAGLEK